MLVLRLSDTEKAIDVSCHFILEKEAGFFAKRIRAERSDSIPVEFSHFGRRVVSQ
jgi:hypothetical protein